jgi:glycosyltransferase involved in cell wall biosynthesis
MAEKISHCLQSIIDQTIDEYVEVIVVDDGSSDDTASVISGFADLDSRVKYFYEQNAGVSSARNMGIRAANGRYILFIDADDSIEDGYLQNIINQARATDADLLIWGIKRCLADDRIEEWKPEIGGRLDRKAFLKAFPSEQYGRHKGLYGFVSNKLVKREIVESFGLYFNPTISLMEDYDFFIGCYSCCDSFFCFYETGYRYTKKTDKLKDVSFQQLINIHCRCAELLNNEDAMTVANERLILDAIGHLSLSLFLEEKAIDSVKAKSYMNYLLGNRYCLSAIKQLETRWKLLKHLILMNSVTGVVLFVKLWRHYLSITTRHTV